MPDQSLRVVARVKARPETVEQVREVLLGLVEPTRNEAGCAKYELLQNRKDPTDFTFVEEWDSDAAFEGHFTTSHIKSALPKLTSRELTPDDPDIQTYVLLR
jgi:quinol monooxygenase YgiN